MKDQQRKIVRTLRMVDRFANNDGWASLPASSWSVLQSLPPDLWDGYKAHDGSVRAQLTEGGAAVLSFIDG